MKRSWTSLRMATTVRRSALALLLMAVPGSVYAAQAPAPALNTAPAVDVTASQTELEVAIRQAVNRIGIYSIFDDVSFRVQDGHVTLQGQVVRPAMKNAVMRVVKGIDGVTGIDNRIEVLPLSAYDDSIRVAAAQAIYGTSALNRYALQGQPSIRIIVKNGNITLKGVVNNELDRNIAYVRVAGLPGSFSVTNQLRLDSVI